MSIKEVENVLKGQVGPQKGRDYMEATVNPAPNIVLVLFLGSPELGSIPVTNLECLGLRLYQRKALVGGGA